MRKLLSFVIVFLACSLNNSLVYSKEESSKNATLPKFITFPLQWQPSPRMRMLEMGIHPQVIQSLASKYTKKPSKPVKNDTVQIFKYLDNEFFAQVLLGHPGKPFNMILDTSWGDSYVPSASCPETNIACRSKNRYDHSISSKYVNPNKKYNVSGMIGDLAMDLLHLGHVNVTNFTFAELTYVPKSLLFNKADGILGMAFKELSAYNTLPFFYRLTELNPQMEKVFSFYFNRNPATKKSGTLALGMVQTKHFFEPLNYFNVISNNYWEIQMDKVIFEESKTSNYTLCPAGCKALFDTGTSTIGVTPADLDKINRITRATEVLKFGRFSVDCNTINKLPDIHFIFNGIEHSIKGKEYVQNFNLGPLHFCVTAFVASPLPETWTLGGTFLYRHYSVFDLQKRQIGLAKVKF
ncbi:aspartic protease 4 [Nilaparvata lugens]|uniref:aspartic protease 4 n=1 Tax=Nilaparvata lugens TaxID=108931 RepID=UPI00193CD0BB|nr:aspartic protease 4 [Nilaparvata lugens]